MTNLRETLKPGDPVFILSDGDRPIREWRTVDHTGKEGLYVTRACGSDFQTYFTDAEVSDHDGEHTGPQPQPKTGTALRDNAGKPELSELFHFDLAWLADHTQAGRVKYPDPEPGFPNWKLGGKPDAEYMNSMTRHIEAFIQGEEYDKETGTHHLAAVAWNCLALLTCNRKGEPTRVEECSPSSSKSPSVSLPQFKRPSPPPSSSEPPSRLNKVPVYPWP